jgi:DNA processing protein
MTFQYQEDYCFGFSQAPGIGPLTYQLLVKHFTTAKKAFTASEHELIEVLGASITKQFLHFRGTFDPDEIIAEYKQNNITVISQYSPLYPRLLLQIPDPPICLFALHKDNQPETNTDSVHIAIVGSRNHSTYGKTVTYQIAFELAQAGITIVSGLALGIDAIAHQAALDAGGRTIAVLGCGVDIVYPPYNRGLRQQIIKSGNTLLSEFPPRSQPSRGSFVVRNRVVSGMSKGVLITEGTERSGSLITASNAANQGRDVFAIPGHINSSTAQAPLLLLKQGAKFVTTSDDILTEYSLQDNVHHKKVRAQLTTEQQEIYAILEVSPQFADEIAVQLTWSIIRVMNVVSILEIEGIIGKDSDGRYAPLSIQ